MRSLLVPALLALLAASALAGEGALVVAGGGPTLPEIAARALALAGGTATARVLVVPQASSDPEAGAASVAFWREAGARTASALDLGDREAALAAVRAADLVWIPGGDQARLTRALEGTGVVEAVAARLRAGGVVGGTSAGAAALPAVMIAGEGDLDAITAGSAVTASGLALWPGAIVDQHLLARRRLPRLIAAVLDHPSLVGVGVDERTAAIVAGGRLEVVGRGQVVVVDAREARGLVAPRGERSGATGLRVHVLREGMSIAADW